MARMSGEERIAQAKECLLNGMTIKGWCAENDVPAPTMCAWVRRLHEERLVGLAPAFVEVAADADRQQPPKVARSLEITITFQLGTWNLPTAFQKGRLEIVESFPVGAWKLSITLEVPTAVC